MRLTDVRVGNNDITRSAARLVGEIAQKLAVSEKEVIEMNRRLASSDQSLNAPVTGDGDGEWQDWLLDTAQDQETQLLESEPDHRHAPQRNKRLGNHLSQEAHPRPTPRRC